VEARVRESQGGAHFVEEAEAGTGAGNKSRN